MPTRYRRAGLSRIRGGYSRPASPNTNVFVGNTGSANKPNTSGPLQPLNPHVAQQYGGLSHLRGGGGPGATKPASVAPLPALNPHVSLPSHMRSGGLGGYNEGTPPVPGQPMLTQPSTTGYESRPVSGFGSGAPLVARGRAQDASNPGWVARQNVMNRANENATTAAPFWEQPGYGQPQQPSPVQQRKAGQQQYQNQAMQEALGRAGGLDSVLGGMGQVGQGFRKQLNQAAGNSALTTGLMGAIGKYGRRRQQGGYGSRQRFRRMEQQGARRRSPYIT